MLASKTANKIGHDQVGFIPETNDQFIIRQSMIMLHCINGFANAEKAVLV